MENRQKLKTREKVLYGLGDLGNNIAYGAVGFYLVFFLTDVAGLSPIWAGYIFMISRAWNALCDLFMGMLSDRTRSRYGRRRPFLLFGALPLAVGFALLWMVPFSDMVAKIIYYTLIGLVFNTLYSLVAIPYNALLPELSQDYDERTSISGYKMAFSFVGSLLSAVGAMFIVDVLYPGKPMYPVSFPLMGVILACVLAVCVLLAFVGTKERVAPKPQEKQENVFKSIKSLLRLRAFRRVLGVFIFNMVAFDIIMALYVYYMKYALGVAEDLTTIFMALPLVAAIVVTPLWVGVSEKLGKQKTYIISAIYFLLPLVGSIFLPAGNLVLTGVLTVLIGFGISASQVLVFSILPDVVEVDEAQNGVRREGVIYGATMLLYKISSAVLVALVTASLGWFGYVESTGVTVVQSSGAIQGIRILMGAMPVLCLILSVLCIRGLNLGRQSFNDMKKTLDPQA